MHDCDKRRRRKRRKEVGETERTANVYAKGIALHCCYEITSDIFSD